MCLVFFSVYSLFLSHSGSSSRNIQIFDGLTHTSSSLILGGVIPTVPLAHTVGISTRTVALYHRLFTRCPKLGIQPFVKALCDAEGIPFKPHLSTQLSIAFDLYVAILNGVRGRVLKALGRDIPNWRMLNTCPACQYRLQGEEQLDVRMLAAMDGNDSLRRVERTNEVQLDDGESGPMLASSRERPDHRVGGADYFLSPVEVDQCDEKNWDQVNDVEGLTVAEQHLWAEGRCEDRWHNAQDKQTARSVGKFMECGWFALLCRHMMLLKCCDMIRSGEQ